jgi:hypothetical protein
MRQILLLLVPLLTACFSRQECLETMERHGREIERDGGLTLTCPPDADMAIFHTEGPPYAGTICLPVDFEDRMPDCESLVASEADASDLAICRAYARFPDQVRALGSRPLVYAEGSGETWDVRFATPNGQVPQRGLRVIVGHHAEYDALGISWVKSP